MEAILHCLRKNCFLDGDDDSNDDSSRAPPRHLQVDRDSSLSSILYQPPTPSNNNEYDEVEFNVDTDLQNDYHEGDLNTAPGHTGTSTEDETDFLHHEGNDNNDNQQPAINSIFNFLQNIGNQHRHRRVPPSEEDATNLENTNDEPLEAPHLRAAKESSVSTDDNIPTIALSEVVLPGSQLQKLMAMNMKTQGYIGESEEDECVICMEGFDSTNPRMPTLCGCGANKTFFHLPCLYHWIEQSRDCPSCRKKLTWEEF
jgi:hypothetical protein